MYFFCTFIGENKLTYLLTNKTSYWNNCTDIASVWNCVYLGLLMNGRGGENNVSLPKICRTVTHILQRWNLAELYLTLKKTPKIYESHVILLEFCWHQSFFIGNQKIFSILENRNIDCILVQIYNYFLFLWL